MASLSAVSAGLEAWGAAASGLAVFVLIFAIALSCVKFAWIRVFQRASSMNAVREDNDDDPGLGQKVPDIFLSHAARQKGFVESLYNELKRTNHTAFFHTHSSREDFPFPPHILRAALGCKVGVVVLSDDFLNSSQSMLELEILVSQRGSNAIVLPLFYELSATDLKACKNRLKSQWTWTKRASKEVNRRIRAIEALNKFNGEVYAKGITEAHYIKRIVQQLCKLVPVPISYDLASVQGQRRLVEVVAKQFSDSARQNVTARMVGLHGVGGLGKTTICKMMVNFYNLTYPGKSHLLELPSDGDVGKVVQKCKEALKMLANLSDELLNKISDFDEVAQWMKESLRQHDVFLAIDNVWESSRDQVERILAVGFSSNSKILLTSRSEQILKGVLRDHGNTYRGLLPTPNEEEALQIFQEPLCRGNIKAMSAERSHVLHEVVSKCCFSSRYHPLALRALGQYVMSVNELEGFRNIEDCLPFILEEIRNSDLKCVEEVIRFSYEKVPELKKRVFIDIIVVLISNKVYGEYDTVLFCLSMLYKSELNKLQIAKLIHELASDGLIELKANRRKGSKGMITVHDLYSDLAWREARSRPTFLMDESVGHFAEEIEWARLERVILMSGKSANSVRNLLQHKCPKLQWLCIKCEEFQSALDLGLMPSLRALELRSVKLRSIENWSAAKVLALVSLSSLECDLPLKPIPILPCLEALIVRNVCPMESPPKLHGCQHLQYLDLAEASAFEVGEEANYFNTLTNLENLTIEHFNSFTRENSLNALGRLQMLNVKSCLSVENMQGLDALQQLEWLDVSGCPCLKNLDGLGALCKLEHLHVADADQLKRIPDLRGLHCLTFLKLSSNELLEEVGGLSLALELVSVTTCRALKRLPDTRGLSALKTLDLCGNQAMEELEGLSPALQRLFIEECDALKKITALSSLTGLETLELCENQSLEEVVGLMSPSLKRVTISSCRALKEMPDFSDLTSLQKLELELNKGMQEVGAEKLSAACCKIECSGPGIEKLGLIDGEWSTASSMERKCDSHLKVDGGCFPSRLISLEIGNCDSLVKLEVGCLSQLRALSLWGCSSLEETGDLSALHDLGSLSILGCPRLKKIGCLPTRNMARLHLINCPSLEVSSLPDVSSIQEVTLRN